MSSRQRPPASGRNRPRTEEEILRALEEQIREEGVMRTGINTVAKRAGVSKELIYRYFGGMDGLVLAMMNGQDYWTRPGDIPKSGVDEPAGESILAMLLGQLETLRGNEIVQEIRRWELIEADDTRQKLAKRREAAARGFIDRIAAQHRDAAVDVPAVTGILLAGVLYLVLRAKTENQFLGVPLDDEAGWRRYETALELMVERIFREGADDDGD